MLLTPSAGSQDLGLDTPVVLTFSEALSPTTVSTATVNVYANGALLNPTVTRSADNRTVTLTRAWPADSTIVVLATSAVTDLAGNALADLFSAFTTTSDVDNTRPSVVTQRPGNGASGIAVNRGIALYLNEPLEAATVPGSVYVSQNGVLVAGTTQLTGNDRVLEFVPATPWAPNALVQIFLQATALDREGNAVNQYQGQFRTVLDLATTAPTVLRYWPAAGATNTPRNAWLEVD